MANLLHSPLHDRHVELGAKLAPFGGWEMPIEYAGAGVLSEHAAVRGTVGLFDVSHLGKLDVRGTGAADYCNATLTNDLARVAPGQAQYTLCCDDASGGVVDDLIAYLRGDDHVFLVPNAANTAEVGRRLRAAAPGGVDVVDRHRDIATIAVQGPRSPEVLQRVGLPYELDYMSFVNAGDVVVCRSGYTGEHGYELMPPASAAAELWDKLLDVVRELGGLPCGLGARDTLRTEMGYPLHGQDISLDVTPVQARLTWAVGWKKPVFWGRDVLLKERETGPIRLLRGVEAVDRAIPRPHTPVLSSDGQPLGELTSGTFSPTKRVGIGLGLLDRSVDVGDEVQIDVRGRLARARVVQPPFVDASPK